MLFTFSLFSCLLFRFCLVSAERTRHRPFALWTFLDTRQEFHLFCCCCCCCCSALSTLSVQYFINSSLLHSPFGRLLCWMISYSFLPMCDSFSFSSYTYELTHTHTQLHVHLLISFQHLCKCLLSISLSLTLCLSSFIFHFMRRLFAFFFILLAIVYSIHTWLLISTPVLIFFLTDFRLSFFVFVYSFHYHRQP